MEEDAIFAMLFFILFGVGNDRGLLVGPTRLGVRRGRRMVAGLNDDIVVSHQQLMYMALITFRLIIEEYVQAPRFRRMGHIFRSDCWWRIDVLQHFNNNQWREHFRMTKPTFNYLCDRLEPIIRRKPNKFGRNMSTKKCVAITIYRLATCCDLRTIANLFGVARCSACVVVHQVCRAIVQVLRAEYVVWPTDQRLTETINGFQQKHGFPQCAGAIDGSHIPIISPNEFAADYYNRKGWHSIVLQAVADNNLRFTDLYVGWPGKVHDARILRNSALYEKGVDGQLFPRRTVVINGVHVPIMILGDPAYPLMKWLMKGFPVTENITREQTVFNYRLSKARMVVERAFGMLKGRWRILMKRNDSALKNVGCMVMACCILHNLCIDEGEIYNPEWEIPEDLPQPEPHEEVNPQGGVSANDIRAALVQMFA